MKRIIEFAEDCKVWKYPRKGDDIPDGIKVEALDDEQVLEVEGAKVKVCVGLEIITKLVMCREIVYYICY